MGWGGEGKGEGVQFNTTSHGERRNYLVTSMNSERRGTEVSVSDSLEGCQGGPLSD